MKCVNDGLYVMFGFLFYSGLLKKKNLRNKHTQGGEEEVLIQRHTTNSTKKPCFILPWTFFFLGKELICFFIRYIYEFFKHKKLVCIFIKYISEFFKHTKQIFIFIKYRLEFFIIKNGFLLK